LDILSITPLISLLHQGVGRFSGKHEANMDDADVEKVQLFQYHDIQV